jgi:hypothetical protein
MQQLDNLFRMDSLRLAGGYGSTNRPAHVLAQE